MLFKIKKKNLNYNRYFNNNMYLIYGFNYISSDNNIKRFSAKNIPPPMLKIYFTTYANILFMKIFDSNFKNFLPFQI